MRSNMELCEYLESVTERVKENAKIVKRYDIDAIVHCLRNGFINYCKGQYHIFTSYEEIGKAFPSLYPVDKV